MAHIIATSTGLPPHYYPQDVMAAALRKYCLAMELDFDLDSIDRFFTNVKIDGRYCAFPLDSFFDPPNGMEETVGNAVKMSVDLVADTVTRLLDTVGLTPQDINQITSVSLIPAVPSLDARLMNQLPFSPNLVRMPLGGVGCMGSAIGVSRAADYLSGHPDEASILFSVELSSGLWQGPLQRDMYSMITQLPNDPSQYSDIIMTIVTAALFSDGAAAVLMVGDEHPLASQSEHPRVVDRRSVLLPNTVHLMGMEVVNTGTRNILRPEVSDHVKVGLRQAIDPLLAEHGLAIDDIARWLVHPGGPKIIQAVEAEFGLDEQLLQSSRDALAKYGNMSSPTVLFILDACLAGDPPPPGSYGLMVAMGPGFSQEAILLQW
ncbi:MAG: type III polyketide synthase [Synechococcus sp.]